MKRIIFLIILLSCNKIIRDLDFKNKDINEDLALAIIKNTTYKAIELINQGANVNYIHNNKLVIELALDSKNLDILEELLKKGVELNENSTIRLYDLALEDFNSRIIDLIKDKYKLKEGLISNNKYFLLLCYTSNADEIEDFIKRNNINPNNIIDKRKINGLIISAAGGKVDIAKILIEKYGLNVNYKSGLGETALMIASFESKTEAVKLLIAKGSNINDKEEDGNTALMYASIGGQVEVVKLLIENGSNINDKNNDGCTALMLSSEYGQIGVAKLLIEKYSDINDKNRYGYTVLMLASENGRTEVAKLLIAEGSNINDKNFCDNTALMLALRRGQTEVAKLLIEKGSNINDKDKYCETALMMASENGQAEVAKLLIAKGSNINDKNFCGNTALMLALRRGQMEIVKLLIENFCEMDNNFGLDNIIEETIIDNVKSRNIENSLLIAANYKNILNFDYRDSEGNTFLHHIAEANYYKLFKLFLNNGVNVNTLNNKGETPMYRALSNPNFKDDFIWYLLNNGASLEPSSYIKDRLLLDILLPYEELCNKLIYEPLTIKLLNNINLSFKDKNKIRDVIRKLKLKEIDFDENKEMINFIRNILFLNENLDIDLNNTTIDNINNQGVELNIEVFDEIFRHFEDEDYWDSIIGKVVDYVKKNHSKELDQISLDYLDCIKNKGLDYAKSNFNLDKDKKFNINKLIKEKINYIKNIFKDKLLKLQNVEPINMSLLEMNQKEREQNTDFQRKKQLSNLLKIISLMAVQGDNYDKIKFSINQILDIMVCREGSLEALNEAIRYVSLGEMVEVDQSIKSILDEELMKLRYELFKEVVNQEINENKIKLSILIDGRRVEIKAEMVPELLPSILKTMYDDLKIKLEYLDSDDNYNFIYNKEYIIEEIKRRYKDRIINYVIDKIENNKILWTKVRDYIERNIFEGRAVLQIEDFVYDEDYRIKRESIIALLLHLNYLK